MVISSKNDPESESLSVDWRKCIWSFNQCIFNFVIRNLGNHVPRNIEIDTKYGQLS